MNRDACTIQHPVGAFVHMGVYVDPYVQVHVYIHLCAYLGEDLTWRKKTRG